MSELPIERPLTPAAKAGLIASTTLLVFGFYLCAILSGVLIAALLAVELVVVLVALRFGLAGYVVRAMEGHVRVATILLRSLWLNNDGVEYRIKLNDGDAPELFTLIRQLAGRFELAPPSEVVLEMSVNAWVHLKGLRSGAGSTRIGIGYDLLSGLTVSEVEAVLAHELAHAKLIQRGFKRFANSALARCGKLFSVLAAHVQEGADRNEERELAEALLRGADVMIRALARCVAAYSRQDEFEADRGAAQTCGANSIRSSLLKLGPLSEASARLPWRARVARLQSGQSYSEWFAREVSAGLQPATPHDADRVFDRYSTHPRLQDRLAALPADVEKQCNNTPATTLFSHPDAVVEKLIAEIQRVGALEEEKDSKRLAKWARTTQRRTRTRPLQWLAIGVGVIGLAGGIIGIPIGLAIATILWRKGRYSDPVELPIPGYAQLTTQGPKPLFEQQKQMEDDLTRLAENEKGKKRKAAAMVEQSYKALANCDYLRAHVAARVCFKYDPKSIEGRLAFSIASAGVGQADASAIALNYVRFETGLRTDSTAWGAAWALILLHDWTAAEALLDRLVQRSPEQRTFLCLLALMRSRRGKLNSSIAIARQACTPSPRDKEQAGLLIRLLLDAGLRREAAPRLQAVETVAKTDPGLQMQMLRLKLLTGAIGDAEEWVKIALESDAAPARLIAVGSHFLQARHIDRAAECFKKVLAQGHFPEAYVGLADVEHERHNDSATRELLLQALNLNTPPAEGAVGPLALFHPINTRLIALAPVAHCEAWTATIRHTANCHNAFKGTEYLVYATNLDAAMTLLREVFVAMDRNFTITAITFKKARRHQQPARPVRPGIHRVSVLAKTR